MSNEDRRRSARLGQSLDCLGNPVSAGLGLLALVDPSGVLIAMGEGQFLVRGLSGWVLGKGLGELGWLDDDPLLEVLDEFDVHLIAGFHLELPEQVFAEAEITLTAVDHEPRAIFDTVDMRKYLRSLAAKRCCHFFRHDDRVAAALSS
jgi:hypothetical protein